MTALIFLLALALVGVGVVLGALLLNAHQSEQQAWFNAREARLNTLWRSLQATNRISAAFWNAREAMRREAERQRRMDLRRNDPFANDKRIRGLPPKR